MAEDDLLATLVVEAEEAAIAMWAELGYPRKREAFNAALNAHPEWKIYLETGLHRMDGTTVYGSCYTADSETWVACLRAGATRWHQDFAFYHEVGHIIRGDSCQAGDADLVAHDDEITTPQEVFADAFAHATMRLVMYGASAVPEATQYLPSIVTEPEALQDFYRHLRGER